MTLTQKQKDHLKKNILVLLGRIVVALLGVATFIYGIRSGKLPSGPNRGITLQDEPIFYYIVLVILILFILIFIYGIGRSIKNIHDVRQGRFNKHL